MYSRSAKGGEKGDPNCNPWLAKMKRIMLIFFVLSYTLARTSVIFLVVTEKTPIKTV